MAADQKIGLIEFDATVFQGEKESYASRGMCSVFKTDPAVKMNVNPSRRKAYCDPCAKRFGH